MPYTEEELKEIDGQQAYWQELADACGWELCAWTLRRTAIYETARNKAIDVTGSQRDDIMRAIAKAKGEQ